MINSTQSLLQTQILTQVDQGRVISNPFLSWLPIQILNQGRVITPLLSLPKTQILTQEAVISNPFLGWLLI